MAFRDRYICEFRSKYKKHQWKVLIAEHGYLGEVTEMKASGSSPLQITWEGRGDMPWESVKGSEVKLSVLCETNFDYISMFTTDPRRFRMTVYLDGAIYWRGYMCADTYSESFAAPPYDITFSATDGFALLKDIPFLKPDGTEYTTTVHSLRSLVDMCLEQLALDMPLEDWIRINVEANTTNDTLSQCCVDTNAIYHTHFDTTYADVLNIALSSFGAQIFQARGKIHIRRVASLNKTYRPFAFYAGQPSRPIREDMWVGNAITDKSVLKILPALPAVEFKIINKSFEDITHFMDPYSISSWRSIGNGAVRLISDFWMDGMYVWTKNPGGANNYIAATMFETDSVFMQFKVEFSIASRPMDFSGFDAAYMIKAYCDDGSELFHHPASRSWVTFQSITTIPVATSSPYDYPNQSVLLPPLPKKGRIELVVESKQLCFGKFKITIEDKQTYDDKLNIKKYISPSVASVSSIEIAATDMVEFPNAKYIQPLYFKSIAGQPTRIWQTDEQSDTLVNIITEDIKAMCSSPIKQISAQSIFNPNIDLNTVYSDARFTLTNYFVNYIDIDTLNEDTTLELTEVGAASIEHPGYDYRLEFDSADFVIKDAIVLYGKVWILATNGSTYIYDIAHKNLTASPHIGVVTAINEGHNCVCVLSNNKGYAYNFNGILVSEIATARANHNMTLCTYGAEKKWWWLESIAANEHRVTYDAEYNEYLNLTYTINGSHPTVVDYNEYGFVVSTDSDTIFWDSRIHVNGAQGELKSGYILAASEVAFYGGNGLSGGLIKRHGGEMTGEWVGPLMSFPENPSICINRHTLWLHHYNVGLMSRSTVNTNRYFNYPDVAIKKILPYNNSALLITEDSKIYQVVTSDAITIMSPMVIKRRRPEWGPSTIWIKLSCAAERLHMKITSANNSISLSNGGTEMFFGGDLENAEYGIRITPDANNIVEGEIALKASIEDYQPKIIKISTVL